VRHHCGAREGKQLLDRFPVFYEPVGEVLFLLHEFGPLDHRHRFGEVGQVPRHTFGAFPAGVVMVVADDDLEALEFGIEMVLPGFGARGLSDAIQAARQPAEGIGLALAEYHGLPGRPGLLDHLLGIESGFPQALAPGHDLVLGFRRISPDVDEFPLGEDRNRHGLASALVVILDPVLLDDLPGPAAL